MTRTTSDSLDDRLSTLWRSACDDYAKATGISPSDGDFPKIHGPEDLSRQLDAEKDHFEDFRMKKRPLLHAMQMILAPFENWGDLLAGAASAAFPPAVSESFDMLTDLFHKLGHFALRLDSYKGVPLSEGMKTIIVKVLVNFLRVCAASQKLLSRGSLRARLTKWTKNVLVEDTSISSLLGELEELTSQEHKMVSAHGLDLTHQALRNTAELLERDDNRNERERLDTVKKALDPVSASGRVFSSINENRIPGSGSWIEDRIRSWWQSAEPLLWIHGIISDLAAADPSAPSASNVASFFFKNNDVDLRSFNKALRTLAWQVVVQQSRFAAHAEDFCLKEDPANSYVVWRKLLLDYFVKSAPDAGTCFIIDGIDEADPEEQEILFSLLESTYATEDQTNPTAPIRVVLLGRDSVRGILDEHSLGWIPEIEITNNQNKDDLHGYVSQKLQKTKLFRGYPDFLDEVVQDICGQAEGLWEWANLVIKSVLRCRSKEQIRKVVRTMPRGISAMLHAELQRLARELSASDAMSTEFSDDEGSSGEATTQIQQLNLLLSFVTMAQKPLTVDQLDLILEVILEEEVLNLEDDLRTVYSSLFSLRSAVEEVDDDGDEVEKDAVIVTLRHSSFYEFFSTSVEAGPIQVDPGQAEASFVFVLLYALQRRNAPKSERLLEQVSSYAQKFLPLHLERANPEKAANREEIATLLAALLTDEPVLNPQHWLIEQYRVTYVATYNQYMSSRATEIACYWWNTQKRDTANQRAELVLNWLSPDTRQILQDCARSSTVASDACPFTVLFSRLAESFSRLWLAPKDIEEEDGLPEGISVMIFVYAQMAGTEFPTSEGKLAGVVRIALRTVEIMQVAEMQRFEKTPVWHARVAQALLLHNNFKTALEQFQISLDKNHQNPILSKQALSAIHRDMARACTETGRYKEALEHSDLAESLHDASWDRAWQDPIGRLLNTAQMKHFAKMTDKAVVTANEAWETFLGQTEDHRDRYTLTSFWSPHRVQDFQWTEKEGLVEFLASTMTWTRHIIYRLIDLVASAGKITGDLAAAKYSIARISAGIQTWYQLAAHDNPGWDMERAQARSRSRLAAIPFCDEPPLRLDEKADWLRYHALRGRVKKSIELLSDDVPFNDDDAFLSLFQTDEDLSGALYLTKAWYRDYLRETKRDNPVSEAGVAESLNQTQVPDDEVFERRISYTINYFAECSNCKCEMRSICHWYFCCCCPFMMLCQWCYRDIKSALSEDGASHPPGICDPQHEFYYTGGPLQAFERVPEGMMRRTAWIEEWKDQLSEKWETADFAFEGGLSAWCMRVLPEPQRSRWATFFR
ncbi:NACHT domain protein [Aspergillus novofumigatus IBT 16806]|uniref:NACHT domain protein n=1 Tax=Aspergillus novofumigatus (strain IBT 16806) TaxID=1392255 RepID=A0A2I1C5J1_ASPN1|nr:NACHT domain protein [Aspergillus novofumigatus IBT 16806]PKX92831.1 NACHT domain protein [Aspergillus novofumigatus IBT 16806]